MIVGVLFILTACLGWSLVFIIPEFLQGFSPLEISVGRFFFFGLISLIFLITKKRKLLDKSYISTWKKALFLGFLSTIGCYTATVFCIKYASPAVTTLLFGMVPIFVALCGNFRKREYPFRCFLVPCLAMGAGIVFANIEAFCLGDVHIPFYFLGIFCGIIGIVFWIWYVLVTFDFMEKNKHISSTDWVIMIGVSTFFLVIVTAVALICTTDVLSKFTALTDEVHNFFMGTVVLGTICSWGSLYLWTQGNLRLPISLAGQLAIFELVFGLLLIYSVEKHWPLPLEILGIVLMVVGVLFGFKALEKENRKKLEERG